MIHGYYECIVIWNYPVVGEDLLCEHEVGTNPHNMHAVAVKKVIDGNLMGNFLLNGLKIL